ncbi:MAG: glucose-6-phosphate isomerase, partial [Acidimicrobiia bacterium]|nr:glucose-6-phosphate isomerase [Acidimicrobiia bacterium]
MPDDISTSSAWRELARLAGQPPDMRGLFDHDPDRASRLTLNAAGWSLDYSKNRIDDEILELLVELAETAGLPARVEAMFEGAAINTTEGRAVLHTALRTPAGIEVLVDGHDVIPNVHDVLDRMSAFAARVRSGDWVG